MQGDNQEIRERMENVFPEVIGAVITKRGGQVNLCPINYQAISTIYEQPLTICIGLSNGGYTLETILETKEFVYAYPAKDQIHDILYCGTVSGRDGDKLAKTSLEFNQAMTVMPPHLAGAVLNYECRLVHSYSAGGKDSFTVLITEIQQIVPTTDKDNLDKIYSMGGHNYGSIKEMDVLQVGRS
ncbi:MAG: flavin reductase family protein [Candidatus Saccharimonadales bacterium]